MIKQREIPMICPVCGKEFIRKAWNGKYCSRECCQVVGQSNAKIKRHENKKPMPDKTCIGCGKKFSPANPNQKYCTKKCRLENLITIVSMDKPAPTNDPYENLANAIIMQAANDRIKALKRGDKRALKETESFFNSDYFTDLSGANGKYVMKFIDSKFGGKNDNKTMVNASILVK